MLTSSKLLIKGGKKLTGNIDVAGSKNAALAILAATLLTDQTCHLFNVPEIEDIKKMVDILISLGSEVKKPTANEIIITTKNINLEHLNIEAVSQIRASIMIIGSLASRLDSFSLPYPGGCQIGSRPLDAHLNALKDLGFNVEDRIAGITISKPEIITTEITLTEFSPTATVNALLALAKYEKKFILYCAAQDYAVLDVCWFLTQLGVELTGIGTHTITIQGVAKPSGAAYHIMPDPIEAGTWISMAAATKSKLLITDFSPNFLRLELALFKKIGVDYELSNYRLSPNGHYQLTNITVKPSSQLLALKKIHDMPAPGFIPDLLPPLAVLLTQAQGSSLIHDWMYDGRGKYLKELIKMGANINIIDPHRSIIIGPTPLYGKNITSYDLRAGASLIIASLVAQGETIIDNIYQIDRGYQDIENRLIRLGAEIKRI